MSDTNSNPNAILVTDEEFEQIEKLLKEPPAPNEQLRALMFGSGGPWGSRAGKVESATKFDKGPPLVVDVPTPTPKRCIEAIKANLRGLQDMVENFDIEKLPAGNVEMMQRFAGWVQGSLDTLSALAYAAEAEAKDEA